MTAAFDFFSIGHSNIPADRFIALLQLDGAERGFFAPGLEERMAAAYRCRSRAVAYRAKRGAAG